MTNFMHQLRSADQSSLFLNLIFNFLCLPLDHLKYRWRRLDNSIQLRMNKFSNRFDCSMNTNMIFMPYKYICVQLFIFMHHMKCGIHVDAYWISRVFLKYFINKFRSLLFLCQNIFILFLIFHGLLFINFFKQ